MVQGRARLRSIITSVVLPLVAILAAAMPVAAAAAPPLPSANTGTILPDGYVQLEVRLSVSGAAGPMTFNFCPDENLWKVDLKSLLAGAKQVTVGITITDPNLQKLSLTPFSVVQQRSGPFGWNRHCTVNVDEVLYDSPIVSVRRHRGRSFAVSPSYGQSTNVNAGIIDTTKAAVGLATGFAGVPVETATAATTQVANLLNGIAVANTEVDTRYLQIKDGPIPDPALTTWVAKGAVGGGKGSPVRDLTVTARLVPIDSLIPPTGSPPGWTTTSVMTAPYAILDTAVNPTETIGGHMQAIDHQDIDSFATAATAQAASIACAAIKSKVDPLGLSLHDSALLMWALTHENPPAAVSSYDIDRMQCLKDSWANVPPAILATKVTAPPTPPKPAGAAPTVRQMQAATQIDNAFAIFFVAPTWTQRKGIAGALFSYPVTYTDPKALLLPGSTQVANLDQWLELHRDETPIAKRIGCYTYVPSAKTGDKSIMYAIADVPTGAKQVVVTASFANAAPGADAQIDSLSVDDAVNDQERALMLAAQSGGHCESGYTPALLFSH
jgi:hypothetical protein